MPEPRAQSKREDAVLRTTGHAASREAWSSRLLVFVLALLLYLIASAVRAAALRIALPLMSAWSTFR